MARCYSSMETYPQRFAAELLMPTQAVTDLWREGVCAEDMAKIMEVSLPMMRQRINEVTGRDDARLHYQAEMRGFEPLDNETHRRQFSRLVQ